MGSGRFPPDLPEGGRRYDLKRLGGATVDIHCHLPIERQINAIGATWLDRELIKGSTEVPNTEFGSDIRQALKAREDFLDDPRPRTARRRASGARTEDTRHLAGSRDRRAGGADRSDDAPPASSRLDGIRVSGTYRESIQFASGRFAMLDDGVGFSLVPWRPVIENRLGQNLSAVVDGARVNWEFGRSRSRSL